MNKQMHPWLTVFIILFFIILYYIILYYIILHTVKNAQYKG